MWCVCVCQSFSLAKIFWEIIVCFPQVCTKYWFNTFVLNSLKFLFLSIIPRIYPKCLFPAVSARGTSWLADPTRRMLVTGGRRKRAQDTRVEVSAAGEGDGQEKRNTRIVSSRARDVYCENPRGTGPLISGFSWGDGSFFLLSTVMVGKKWRDVYANAYINT